MKLSRVFVGLFRGCSVACFGVFALTALPFPGRADNAPLLKAEKAECLSLEGKPVPAGNPIDVNVIKDFQAPALLLFRSRANSPQGTVMLCPGGGYDVLEMRKEGENTARFLNDQGFDVALLEYHIHSGPKTRELAVADALEAFRLLRTNASLLGLHNGRFAIMGFSAGGNLAARTVQNLAENEQPNDLILIYPAFLDERNSGQAAVIPPQKSGRLFAMIGANDRANWISGCQEYANAWPGGDRSATFHLLPDAGHGFVMTPENAGGNLFKAFLQSK